MSQIRGQSQIREPSSTLSYALSFFQVRPAVLEDFFYFVVWWLQGKLAEALPLYEKSLAIRKQVLGDDHPKVAESLNNIGLLYTKQVL